MRKIFSFFFLINIYWLWPVKEQCKFQLEIWDYNYSLAYTTYYGVNNDSIKLIAYEDIENKNEKVLVNRSLSQKEKESLSSFLLQFPVEKLKNEYKNPLIEDGDQKRVNITVNNMRKTVDIKNSYQDDFCKLFKQINGLLDENNKLRYIDCCPLYFFEGR